MMVMKILDLNYQHQLNVLIQLLQKKEIHFPYPKKKVDEIISELNFLNNFRSTKTIELGLSLLETASSELSKDVFLRLFIHRYVFAAHTLS